MTRGDRGGLWGALWSAIPALLCRAIGGWRFPRAPYNLTDRSNADDITALSAVVLIFAGSIATGVLWERRRADLSGAPGTARFALRFAACLLAAAPVLPIGGAAALLILGTVFGFGHPHTHLEQIISVLPPAIAYSALLYPALDWSRDAGGAQRR